MVNEVSIKRFKGKVRDEKRSGETMKKNTSNTPKSKSESELSSAIKSKVVEKKKHRKSNSSFRN